MEHAIPRALNLKVRYTRRQSPKAVEIRHERLLRRPVRLMRTMTRQHVDLGSVAGVPQVSEGPVVTDDRFDEICKGNNPEYWDPN